MNLNRHLCEGIDHKAANCMSSQAPRSKNVEWSDSDNRQPRLPMVRLRKVLTGELCDRVTPSRFRSRAYSGGGIFVYAGRGHPQHFAGLEINYSLQPAAILPNMEKKGSA